MGNNYRLAELYNALESAKRIYGCIVQWLGLPPPKRLMWVQFLLHPPMNKVISICSEHGDELRLEHLVDEDDHGYTSGFCFKCARHYRLCNKIRYMSSCVKKVGHEGEHIDCDQHTWTGEFVK